MSKEPGLIQDRRGLGIVGRRPAGTGDAKPFKFKE